MQPRKTSVAWQRALQIGVLGLIWGIGILAVAVERSGSGSVHAARPARAATAR